MDFQEAHRIYLSPKGHSKETLTECLLLLNAQGELSLEEQAVIADARDRSDILNGVITDVEYRVLPDKLLGNKSREAGGK